MNSTLDKLRDPKIWGLLFAFGKLMTAALGLEVAPEQWIAYENLFNSACGIAVALGIFTYNPDKGDVNK